MGMLRRFSRKRVGVVLKAFLSAFRGSYPFCIVLLRLFCREQIGEDEGGCF